MKFMKGEIVRLKDGKYLSDICIGSQYVGVLAVIYDIIPDQLSTTKFSDGNEYRIKVHYDDKIRKISAPSIDDKNYIVSFWIGSQGMERVGDVQLGIF